MLRFRLPMTTTRDGYEEIPTGVTVITPDDQQLTKLVNSSTRLVMSTTQKETSNAKAQAAAEERQINHAKRLAKEAEKKINEQKKLEDRQKRNVVTMGSLETVTKDSDLVEKKSTKITTNRATLNYFSQRAEALAISIGIKDPSLGPDHTQLKTNSTIIRLGKLRNVLSCS